MSCEQLRDDYDLYALGTLDGEARDAIARHLRDRCPNCTEGVRQAMGIVSVLALAAPPADPPAALRARVLDAAQSRQKKAAPRAKLILRHTRLAYAALAASLLAAAVLYRNERAAQSDLTRARAELTALRDAMAIIGAPDTRNAGFGAAQPQPPAGRVFVRPGQGVVLIASALPQVPAGKAYAMWIVPKTGAPRPAGLFQPGQDGAALHLFKSDVDAAATAAIAVTIEDERGAPAPTMTPLIVAAL